MYMGVTWNISHSAVESAAIKTKMVEAFGARKRTGILSNSVLIHLEDREAFTEVTAALEAIYRQHRTDFEYAAFLASHPDEMRPVARPTWNRRLVREIRDSDE